MSETETLRAQLECAKAEAAELRAKLAGLTTPRHVSEWCEDEGPVLWWHPGEPPYCGTPNDCGHTVEMRHYTGGEGDIKTVSTSVGGWPGYHEWWTPLPGNEVHDRVRAALAQQDQPND